mmetsp:Transcript_23/g.78  ORF Transcript_23/g.78 Transcript_23/m.78 type:complete len:323 (-) Transcript_23:15-983(-)
MCVAVEGDGARRRGEVFSDGVVAAPPGGVSLPLLGRGKGERTRRVVRRRGFGVGSVVVVEASSSSVWVADSAVADRRRLVRGKVGALLLEVPRGDLDLRRRDRGAVDETGLVSVARDDSRRGSRLRPVVFHRGRRPVVARRRHRGLVVDVVVVNVVVVNVVDAVLGGTSVGWSTRRRPGGVVVVDGGGDVGEVRAAEVGSDAAEGIRGRRRRRRRELFVVCLLLLDEVVEFPEERLVGDDGRRRQRREGLEDGHLRQGNGRVHRRRRGGVRADVVPAPAVLREGSAAPVDGAEAAREARGGGAAASVGAADAADADAGGVPQ